MISIEDCNRIFSNCYNSLEHLLGSIISFIIHKIHLQCRPICPYWKNYEANWKSIIYLLITLAPSPVSEGFAARVLILHSLIIPRPHLVEVRRDISKTKELLSKVCSRIYQIVRQKLSCYGNLLTRIFIFPRGISEVIPNRIILHLIDSMYRR